MILRLYKHLRKVGWSAFKQEFSEKKARVLENPKYILKQQIQGYYGVIIFSIVSSVILAIRDLWFLGAVFVFNVWVVWGQLRGVKLQLKNFQKMEAMSIGEGVDYISREEALKNGQ